MTFFPEKIGQGPSKIRTMFAGKGGSAPTSPIYSFHFTAPKARVGTIGSGGGVIREALKGATARVEKGVVRFCWGLAGGTRG